MNFFPLDSFWFDRFKMYDVEKGYLFFDSLSGSSKIIPHNAIKSPDLRLKNPEIFYKGFVTTCLISKNSIQSLPVAAASEFKWQFPCRTEEVIALRLQEISACVGNYLKISLYLNIPWASLIDSDSTQGVLISLLGVRVRGMLCALMELGVNVQTHTVCQHIFWKRCIPLWRELGITDVWLSHMPSYVDPDLPFKIHPWALYAVNVEDLNRQEGLEIGKDPTSKKLLASFIGAHTEGYISDIRLRLREFADEPDFLIRVTDKWHFEDIVYKHQVQGFALEGNYIIDDSVREYNSVLSDSIFALCPSGAGPNSIRLWEALAVGSIPVLLGKFPILPSGGSLPDVDWDSIVLKILDDQLPQLPQILRAMPMEEIRARQKRGMEAYALVREQRCF
jgi:hypothetical protein